MKYAKLIKSVARITKDRALLESEEAVQKIHDSLLQQLSTSGGHNLNPLQIWTGEWEQRMMLLPWKLHSGA